MKLDSAKFFQLRPQGILAKLAGTKPGVFIKVQSIELLMHEVIKHISDRDFKNCTLLITVPLQWFL